MLVFLGTEGYDDLCKKKAHIGYVDRLRLRKLCWETMFGQELVKLTVMDLVSLIYCRKRKEVGGPFAGPDVLMKLELFKSSLRGLKILEAPPDT